MDIRVQPPEIIDYLKGENRVLREQLGGRRSRFSRIMAIKVWQTTGWTPSSLGY
jgi:hypothetical protein